MDIIAPSKSPKIINNTVTLASGVNVLAAIPPIQIGYLKRLTVNNPTTTGQAANLMVQDAYTPDISEGNPTPSPVVKDRYPVAIPLGDWIDINGHTISKHLGSLQITSDTTGVILGYTLELE